jgi:hypothetical protein
VPHSIGAWLFTGGAYSIFVNDQVDIDGAGIEIAGGSAIVEAGPFGTINFHGNSD